MATISKLWTMTWEECVAKFKQSRTPLLSWEGFIIASQDRKLDPKRGYEMYRNTLTLAYRKGKEIPEHVRLSEPELFARLGGPVEPPADSSGTVEGIQASDEPAEVGHEDLADSQGSLFGDHLDWLCCR